MGKVYDPVVRRAEYLAHKEKANASSRRWYQENKSRHKELMARWLAENRERHLEMQRDWYRRNEALHLERSRAWAAANLPKKALHARARRERKALAAGFATEEQVALRVAYFGWRCSYCGGPFEEVDHAIPLKRGGTAWPANLRPACTPCNRQKATRTVREFLELRRCS